MDVILWALVILLAGPATAGRQQRNKAQWAAALLKEQQEETREWEEERQEREEEVSRNHGLGPILEQGALGAEAAVTAGGSSAAGPALSFVHLKHYVTRAECTELVTQWRDILLTGGFDITPYMVDDHMVLLNLDEKWKVMELKDFVLDPYFAQGKVEAFELNQKKWYAPGSDGFIAERQEKARQLRDRELLSTLKLGELPGFSEVVRSYKSHAVSLETARSQV
jgi:hypothetical protein